MIVREEWFILACVFQATSAHDVMEGMAAQDVLSTPAEACGGCISHINIQEGRMLWPESEWLSPSRPTRRD